MCQSNKLEVTVEGHQGCFCIPASLCSEAYMQASCWVFVGMRIDFQLSENGAYLKSPLYFLFWNVWLSAFFTSISDPIR